MSRAEKQQRVKRRTSAWTREHRLSRGWSQYVLAEKSGIGRGVIALYEHGRRAPGRQNMERLLDAFGIKGEQRQSEMRWAAENLIWK